jgi:hypothetical protein
MNLKRLDSRLRGNDKDYKGGNDKLRPSGLLNVFARHTSNPQFHGIA